MRCMHVQYVSFMYDHEALLPIHLKQCHKSTTLGSYTNFSMVITLILVHVCRIVHNPYLVWYSPIEYRGE